MLTQNEISSLKLSPTKKDFVQIWNELIEIASKITERWDPTSTNESDPGIVLLKALTGIADKLNYNIDKNILEAYMPTAAQMESMRKLCELVGYDIKYYQSAETTVRISYTGNTTDLTDENDEKLPEGGLALPKFTTITNADKDVMFVTTNTIPLLFTNGKPWVEAPCIEGQLSQCESINENNLITLEQLDAANRYYLPEIQIAENGIFVYNAVSLLTDPTSLTDGNAWTQVSNLNTQPTGTRVFKFGYDSFEGRPYLSFPDDVGNLIEDGLFIYFIRTSGLNGNISPRTLEILEIPSDEQWDNYSAEQFEVVNINETTNGANIESISAAYNNFKKTIGTFDTLVTCRDYMNKIYLLMDANNYPYVSNILVTDIRNDINNAITLCSCNDSGILYKETPLTETVHIGSSIKTVGPVSDDDKNGDVYKLIVTRDPDSTNEKPLIDHFDLVLYPFKTFNQVSYGNTELVKSYNRSFNYTESMNSEIAASLSDLKTCAHNLTTPAEGDIVSINNYLRLDALIATSMRVTEAEAKTILKNVKIALINEFNLRNLDFGEEIPFDSILSVIENADPRIKVVSLQEPTVLTTYSVKTYSSDGATSKEYGIASTANIEKDLADKTYKDTIYDVTYRETTEGNESYIYCKTAKEIYNKLVLRNILAGRAALFDYDETFVTNNSEKPYTITTDITETLADADPKNDLEEALISEINTHINNLCAADYEAFKELTADNSIRAEQYIHEVVLATPGPQNGVTTLSLVVNVSKGNSGDNSDDNINVEPIYNVYESSEPFAKAPLEDIQSIEATCELTLGADSKEAVFNNIKLEKNEVIKFRAPNLVSTKTYPAYVYYNYTKASKNSVRDGTTEAGTYASVIPLSKFIDDTDVETFFDGLFSFEGVKLNSFFGKYIQGQPSIIRLRASDLDDIFASSIVVRATPPESTEYEYLLSTQEINNYISKYVEDNSDWEDKEFTFEYYPLNASTMSIWGDFVKGQYERTYEAKIASGELPEKLPEEATVFWRLSTTSGYPKGKLVIGTSQRLFAQSSEYLLTSSNVAKTTFICTDLGSDPAYYTMDADSEIALQEGDKLYIHYTPSSTNEDGETVTAEPVSIVYEGDSEDPIVLKPSGFALIPSEDYKIQNNVSWKKENVVFGDEKVNLLALAPNEQIELKRISRVVLDAPARFYKNFDHEGLEKGSSLEKISYELKDGEYIFYTDQNTQEAAYYGSGSVITLDYGAYIPKTAEEDMVEVSQILEQGLHIVPWSSHVILNETKKITITEYQYVTLVEGDNLNSLALAGNNTKIGKTWQKCDTTQPIIYTTSGANTQTILPKIDISGIGWEVCSLLELSTAPGETQTLKSRNPSTIKYTNPQEPRTNVTVSNNLSIKAKGYDPVNITPQLTALPKHEKLPEASTELEPTLDQSVDSGAVYTRKTGNIVTTGTDYATSANIGQSEQIYEPVSVKLNAPIKVASGNLSTDKDFTETEDIKKLQMKVFKETHPAILTLKDINDTITPISNKESISVDRVSDTINNYWTKVDIITGLVPQSKPRALSLNFMIPDNSDEFGIFSIYLEVPEDRQDPESAQGIPKETARVFIEIPQEFTQDEGISYKDIITIFNYNKNNSEGIPQFWWTEGIVFDEKTSTYRLYLRAGLNCIKVAKSCNLLIKADIGAAGSILYDNMRLVKGIRTHGINLKLIDFDVASVTDPTIYTEADTEGRIKMAEAILEKIALLDKNYEFYYNVPIENSLAIEFDENNITSFSNPYTLYDINNINKDFVVSKLDIKYLDTGLKIAKSSKSQGAGSVYD